jgi:hypothetical protein
MAKGTKEPAAAAAPADTKKAPAKVRVTYLKNAPYENVTVTGVGSFIRGGGQFSEPLDRKFVEDSGLVSKGFGIVTEDQYAAAMKKRADGAKPADDQAGEIEPPAVTGDNSAPASTE